MSQFPEEIRIGFRELSESNSFNTPQSIQPSAHDDDGPILIPIPRVIERNESGGEQAYDLFSRLLKDRIICIQREFDDRLANLVTAQLLFLQSQDSEKPISIYINSPGGVVTSGLAIYDTMQLVKPPIHTTVIGQAASMGSVILLAGEKGQRYAMPNSRIMIHQPSGGSRGTSVDIEIQTRETVRIRETLYNIMAHHTGKTPEEVHEACMRDNFMTPEAAIEFGIIDQVIEPKKTKDLKAKKKK